MRKHMVFTVLVLTLSLIICIPLVTTQVRANVIKADVDIDPDALSLKSNGKFITVYIELPEEYNVTDIVLETVHLEGVQAITDSTYGFVKDPDLMDHDGDGILERMVKFDRAGVISLLIQHMSPLVKQEVTLEVTGNLDDGTTFEGSDTIKVLPKLL